MATVETKKEIKVGDVVSVPLRISEIRKNKEGIIYIAQKITCKHDYPILFASLEIKSEELSGQDITISGCDFK